MSNRDPRQRFDYQNWLNSQVAERAKASLTARDAAFAENNAGVTRAALTQYLNVCAAALGIVPAPQRSTVVRLSSSDSAAGIMP